MQAANNKGTDHTARMRRLICAFVVRIWHRWVSHDVAHIASCTRKCKKNSAKSYIPTWSIGNRGIYFRGTKEQNKCQKIKGDGEHKIFFLLLIRVIGN